LDHSVHMQCMQQQQTTARESITKTIKVLKTKHQITFTNNHIGPSTQEYIGEVTARHLATWGLRDSYTQICALRPTLHSQIKSNKHHFISYNSTIPVYTALQLKQLPPPPPQKKNVLCPQNSLVSPKMFTLLCIS